MSSRWCHEQGLESRKQDRRRGTATETDFDVEALVLFGKLDSFDLPRGSDTKGHGE